MKTTALSRTSLVGLTAAALTLSACTTNSGAPAPKVISTPSGTPDTDDGRSHDALTVAIDSTGISCLDERAPIDLAWFDATWQAHAELEAFSFSLTNPVGVEQVGTPVNVPATNYGGRIDIGGSASWSGRAKVLRSTPHVSWPQRGDTAFWSPLEDQTGLLVFHLRLDPEALASPEGVSFDGVTATYRDADGNKREFTAGGKSTYTFDAARCDA